jgi:hypothetical protein
MEVEDVNSLILLSVQQMVIHPFLCVCNAVCQLVHSFLCVEDSSHTRILLFVLSGNSSTIFCLGGQYWPSSRPGRPILSFAPRGGGGRTPSVYWQAGGGDLHT